MGIVVIRRAMCILLNKRKRLFSDVDRHRSIATKTK